MDAFGKLDINDFMRSYTNRAVHIEEPVSYTHLDVYKRQTVDKLKAIIERLRSMSPLYEDFVRKNG